MTFYDYSVQDAAGNEVSMKQYEGKVVLVVNTATGCGFTPHYKAMESMYEKYHDRGFEILDIPCDQFGHQAPGSDDEIHAFCTSHYDTRFPQMHKSIVNGEGELPLYTWLKSQKGFEGFTGLKAVLMNQVVKAMDPDFKNNPNIKWNFTKFLIDRSGNVIERFEPTADMKKVEEKVSEIL